jgi:hypothetical protein
MMQDTSTQTQTQPNGRTGSNPHADGGKRSKGSLIWRTAALIRNIFSHRGMFWMGVAVSLLFFGINLNFYFALFMGAAGLSQIAAAIAAFTVAGTTTLAEAVPMVYRQSKNLLVNQVFVSASKPQVLPMLNPGSVSDSDRIMKDYRDSDKVAHARFAFMRSAAMVIEGLLGAVFAVHIGVGFGALFGMAMFLLSIVGCPFGIALAVRSAEWELHPEAAKQMNDLLDASARFINFAKV